MASKLKITMKRSLIGLKQTQRGTLKALGLRKPQQSVTQPDTPSVRGQVAKVSHLVEVEEVSD
jgi:large subunit ribosomal protein L30